jgi:hypothetical protein
LAICLLININLINSIPHQLPAVPIPLSINVILINSTPHQLLQLSPSPWRSVC